MASVKLHLDTRHRRKDGTYPLKLAINHKDYFYIGIDVYLRQEEWIGGEIFIPQDLGRQKSIRDYVKSRLSAATNTLYKLNAMGKTAALSDRDLKYAIENNTLEEPGQEPLLFIKHYNAYINGIAKSSTRDTYSNMFRKVERFTNTQTLKFEDMNYAWIKDFEKFMLNNGLSINTASIYLRNIRALFNDAINRDLLSQNLYPFRKFKIKKESTRKRALTIAELKTFRDYECEDHQKQYRDIFMLIFYLRGINIIDLCNLKTINNGYIEYRRSKTGRLYSVKVEPEAMSLIELYKGKNYLLGILDRYSDYRNFRHRLNMNLGEIGTVEKIPGRGGKKKKTGLFPGLSTYWARHSWATIAAGLDIPKETIATALGHGGNSVTDIYIDFDQKKVDEANRKVLDAIK